MKNNSTETLIKRINRLEEKIYGYTEIQAEIYAGVMRFNKTLEKMRSSILNIEKEVQVIENKLDRKSNNVPS